MRTSALIFAFVLTVACYAGFRTQLNARTSELTPVETVELATSPAPVCTKVDFATQIKPIFEAKCQPCHFSGGTMYQRLPFDRSETIKTLGTKFLLASKTKTNAARFASFSLRSRVWAHSAIRNPPSPRVSFFRSRKSLTASLQNK